MDDPARKCASQAPAVDKALEVLEFLADQPDGAAMTEISAGVGRSMNEIYRMVRALELRQFIEKDRETERYSLSLRLFELAHRYPPTARLVRAAEPVMDELAEATRQSCHLAIADTDRIIVVAAVDGPTPMRYGVKIGASFPALTTSSGAVLAADFRFARVERQLEGHHPDARKSLLDRFEAIRATGGEVRQSDVVDGVTNISFAVRGLGAQTIAALTVPYLRQAGTLPERPAVVDLTRRAAREISARLGHGTEATAQ